MVTHVTPPGWPREVRAPDAPEWERTAAEWLLDLCPPDYRGYPTLRRHVLVLARFTLRHIEGCQDGVRRGLREARADLPAVVEGDVVEAAIRTWQREEARLMSAHRAVGLVEQALRGRRFPAQL